MLDPRQPSRVLSAGFDFGVQQAVGTPALPTGVLLWHLPNPVLVLGLLGCSSFSCPLPFGKPGRDSDESADRYGKIPAGLGSRGICYFFLLRFCFRLKGKDLGISRCHTSLGWSSVRWDVVRDPSAGVGDGARVDEGSRLETGI